MDDHLIQTGSPNFEDFSTIATWVKADNGTIVDTRGNNLQDDGDGIELDFNRLLISVREGKSSPYDYSYYTLDFDLPENEWAHLVATFSRNSGGALV